MAAANSVRVSSKLPVAASSLGSLSVPSYNDIYNDITGNHSQKELRNTFTRANH